MIHGTKHQSITQNGYESLKETLEYQTDSYQLDHRLNRHGTRSQVSLDRLVLNGNVKVKNVHRYT